jgi:hypothetical protein
MDGGDILFNITTSLSLTTTGWQRDVGEILTFAEVIVKAGWGQIFTACVVGDVVSNCALLNRPDDQQLKGTKWQTSELQLPC